MKMVMAVYSDITQSECSYTDLHFTQGVFT